MIFLWSHNTQLAVSAHRVYNNHVHLEHLHIYRGRAVAAQTCAWNQELRVSLLPFLYSRLSLFVSLQISDLLEEQLGANTPVEAENLKVGGLESQKSPRPPAGVTKANSNRAIFLLLPLGGFCWSFPTGQAVLQAPASVGDSPAVLAAWQEHSWSCLLPTLQAGPCPVCPRWERLQLEQGWSPGVDGQSYGQNSQNVEYKPSFGLELEKRSVVSIPEHFFPSLMVCMVWFSLWRSFHTSTKLYSSWFSSQI